MKHTAGPWMAFTEYNEIGTPELTIKHQRDGKGSIYGIATLWYQSGGAIDNSESQGNAKLIAAAPDLLDTLSALLANHEADLQAMDMTRLSVDERLRLIGLAADARAAIIKAKGYA